MFNDRFDGNGSYIIMALRHKHSAVSSLEVQSV